MYHFLGTVALPSDILDRFRAVSAAAIDFYLDHPQCIALIVRSARLSDPALAARVSTIFETHFGRLFDTVDPGPLAYPASRLIGLMKWLLAKTRNDFLTGLASGADRASLRLLYLEEWEFLLSILKNGIYQ